MRITRSRLRQIIKEEISRINDLHEQEVKWTRAEIIKRLDQLKTIKMNNITKDYYAEEIGRLCSYGIDHCLCDGNCK
jgi:hypothetical protein